MGLGRTAFIHKHLYSKTKEYCGPKYKPDYRTDHCKISLLGFDVFANRLATWLVCQSMSTLSLAVKTI
jgi:hypothetical protein